MSGIMNMLVAAKTTAAAAVDSFFNRVTLLLNTGSTNGAQNNTFLDSSSNGFSITRNGNTAQGTFTPFSQTGWSNYFPGSNCLSLANNVALQMGASDFTMEAWVYPNSTTNQTIFAHEASGALGFQFSLVATTLKLEMDISTNGTAYATTVTTTSAVTNNQWNHVAVVRSGSGSGNITFYINGVKDATTGTYAGTMNAPSTTFQVGCRYASGTTQPFIGYISNARITKGGALYSATFTPSTVPLTTTVSAGTVSLLTCQSNRFIDNSSNAFAITVSGSVSIQAFSPFAPTAAYSTSVVGGSGYFDGTGDYLTVASNAALQITNVDWTIESWMYLTTLPSASGYQAIAQKGRSASSDYEYFVAINNNAGNYRISIELSTTGSNVVGYNSSTITLRASSWNHFAISKSGTTIYYFVNGAAAGTSTITSATGWYTGTGALGIGANNNGGAYLLFGYMSGLRITKSGALYTTAFTAPTAPPTTTVSAGTVSLLSNFTNAGIYDSASKNVLETVGNAQVSTTQAKWGTTSMYFDGTGDNLFIPSNQNLILGTGDFTVEFWFYATNATNVTQRLITTTIGTYGSSDFGLRLESGSSQHIRALIGGTSIEPTTPTISGSQWYHIAVVRNGSGTNNCTIYLNGSSIGQGTSTANISTAIQYIGGYFSTGPAEYFTGYMDDIRISKFARYTGNFTAPTAAFPTQ